MNIAQSFAHNGVSRTIKKVQICLIGHGLRQNMDEEEKHEGIRNSQFILSGQTFVNQMGCPTVYQMQYSIHV